MNGIVTTALFEQNDAIAAAKAAASQALAVAMPLSFQPVNAHSNFNYVFHCEHEGKRLFLKATLDVPRTLNANLSRDRVFREAKVSEFFYECCDGLVDVPIIINIDYPSYSFLMSDVGDGKENLAEILAAGKYDLYAIGIPLMAESIGRFHALSKRDTSIISSKQDSELRSFIYERLIGAGIRAVVADRADAVLTELESIRECMIHSDLWAKNMLISNSGRMALIDFEGAIEGDPVFDLATIIATGLMPVYQFGVSIDAWRITAERILHHYSLGLDDARWFGNIFSRLIPALAVMLAARVSGPFPYEMIEYNRSSMSAVCRDLIDCKIVDWDSCIETLRRYPPIN